MTPGSNDPPDGGNWARELDELHSREALAENMGGDEKVRRQHDRGKLDVRRRIDLLLDAGSFHEIGKIAGTPTYDDEGNLVDLRASNFVFGRGRIDDRTVVVAADDFTVRGGAADASIITKQIAAEQMALELRLPLVRLIDGTGGGGSVKTLDSDPKKQSENSAGSYGRGARTYVPANPGWEHVVANLATVPVVALCLGPVAGLGAARAVSSHYSVMVKGLSQLFVAGPPVVNRLGLEEVDKESLGGSRIHTRNGAVDAEVGSEEEAFEHACRFLSYLPSSIHELPGRGPVTDDPERTDDSLLDVVPRDRRHVYRMRDIVESVFDQGSFFEIGARFGRSAITGLARLDGWPVAVLAGDPYHYGGGWTADASQKVVRFVDLAETFHLPVVHLVDNPGFVIGTEAERAATIRHGSRALAAVYQATVPWCSILVRKAFGVAGAAHSPAHRFQYRYAWPSGDWGSLPVEGGVEAAYRSDLEQSDDPEALLAEITERLNSVRSPFRTAEAFLVEEIIDPRGTRPLLCEFANLAAPLRTTGPSGFGYRP
ncbi:MAG TPA: carboxyl transferase domain-containing protein [Acidimicrobiales bacterium]|jgi:acetyl-CoA carboxylase carboxyltransferase component|nr:methylmalonyl-CoA carboxyltransferase [Actinomycetes bacterium]MDP6106235.1 carboxyl transferase domain-containing protein [Acidimicrobiales bacterium]MCP4844215.1 methylmalonyl-CoA carboxyltransferase [Actinomycetes bacterium]MDP7123636.1 carboxyl transferase domain-containing protein [Acidimicrobiales bacterium]MDP7352141.1 carboxyl transferase domain-containing protein [Acidimicrobiales bacterium]|tara:strand:+ start:15422 stop:17050 length:1629 start_codon:yes stop_codon:yes gene_type:complete